MSAKVSLDFGDCNYGLPVDKALEFFQGCSDAFVEMGLSQFCQPIDLVQVVRIYPNHGIVGRGMIVVEVVVCYQEDKRHESFQIALDQNEIRANVKVGVIQTAKKLSQKIRSDLNWKVQEVDKRLVVEPK